MSLSANDPHRGTTDPIGSRVVLGCQQGPANDDNEGLALSVSRTTDETFRALFEQAPIPYHEIDHNGVLVRINEAECDLLCVRAEDVIGRPVWEMVSPDQRELSRAAVARKLREGTTGPPYERRYCVVNGVERTFEFHERVIVGPRGEVMGIRTAMIDLTESKRAQQKIAFQARLLEQVNDAVVAVDQNFRITFWNRAAERLFGRSAVDVLGTDYSEAVQDTFDAAEKASIRREFVKDGELNREVVCRRGSGEEVVVELSATLLRDDNGQVCGAVGIHKDLTTRRRAEAALAISEVRYKLAQRALGIGSWELDVQSRRITSSPENGSLYGIPAEEQVFDSLDEWHARVHPQDRERVAREDREDCLKGVYSREFRVIWPDGSVHWIASRSNAVFDQEQRPVRVIGLNIDITAEKQAQERIRVLFSAVEQSPVSILLTDRSGTIQYANPKTTEVTGYSIEELLGTNPRILKSGETSPEVYRELWDTIPHAVWRGVFRNRRKNGDLFWEAVTIGPIQNASGEVTHYLALKEDITEKRATEEALRLSDERFRVAAESSGDLIYEWDLSSDNVEILSKKAIAPTDPSGVPLKGTMFLSTVVHADDRDRVQSAIRRNWETGARYSEEYQVTLPTGQSRYWMDSGSAVRDAAGKPVKWVGVVKDITDIKAAERANAELAAIVESAETGIVCRDLDGTVTAWNAGAQRIYGYKAAEIVGRNIAILVPQNLRNAVEEIDQKIRGGERIAHLETVRLTKTGEHIDVLMTVTPIRNRSGQVVGAAHLTWDISETRILQLQLVQAQKLESVGRLAAGIAHEINTPVQYIGDNAEFLAGAFRDFSRLVALQDQTIRALRCGPTPGLADTMEQVCQEIDVEYLCREMPVAINQVSQGAKQVARIVRAMKEFSHPGSSDKALVDINRAIESTAAVCKNEWKYVADLTTEFDPALPAVRCLSGEFNQVILNLIVNAAHAIGDAVNKSGRKGAIHIATQRNGNWAEVRVSDTGIGIPEAIRSKVFDPFFTTKEVGKGTGQGLSIAYDVIVKKHSGRLSFETTCGRGTTFLVQLPLEKQETA